VTSAHNGFEAFEIILQSRELFQKTNEKADLYDAVILDLNMPILNGYDACKSIHGQFE
jgi:CheY-like chemotaxis protein